MKFVPDKSKRKLRQRCKSCNRRTSLVKINKQDTNEKVVRCNSCGSESVIRRAKKDDNK